MKNLVDNNKTRQLNEFIDEFLDIIEEINQNVQTAQKYNVIQIDSKTLQKLVQTFSDNKHIQNWLDQITKQIEAFK